MPDYTTTSDKNQPPIDPWDATDVLATAGGSAIAGMPDFEEAFARYQGIPVGTYTPKTDEVIRMIMGNPNMSDAEKATTIKGLQSNMGLSDEDFAYVLQVAGVSPPSTTPEEPAPEEPGIVDKAQDKLNRGFSKIGDFIDDVFDVLGIPKTSHTVFNPTTGTWDFVWGNPGGSVYGKVGTSRGGTVYGVRTGIPGLDDIISKTADIIAGRVGAGEVINRDVWTGVMEDVIRDTTGLPEGVEVEDIVSVLEEQGTDATKIATGPGDINQPPSDTKTPTTVGGDINQPPSDTKTPTTVGGGLNEPEPEPKTPYVDLNEPESEPESETPTPSTETPTADSGGGGGLGYQQGIATHKGDPSGLVDIDYLFDIAGSSIFAPKKTHRDEEEEDPIRPYVYAKSGGMIRNNYDLTDEIIRLLRGK